MNILYCGKCHIYTLKETCLKCLSKTHSSKPARFSPQDKYGKWRRLQKRSSKSE